MYLLQSTVYIFGNIKVKSIDLHNELWDYLFSFRGVGKRVYKTNKNAKTEVYAKNYILPV